MLKVFLVALLVTVVSSLKVGMRNLFQKVAICGASLAFVSCEVPSSFADSRNIANIQTSGVIFKGEFNEHSLDLNFNCSAQCFFLFHENIDSYFIFLMIEFTELSVKPVILRLVGF